MGIFGSLGNAALLFPAVKVEIPLGQGMNMLCALSVQVLDPELEVADLAFPPSTISASSLKMQVSGAGRKGDTSCEAAIPAGHPVFWAWSGQAQFQARLHLGVAEVKRQSTMAKSKAMAWKPSVPFQ